MHLQNLVRFHQFVLKILSGNEIPTSNNGQYSVTDLQKLMRNNPNLNVFAISMHMQNLIRFQQLFLEILNDNEIRTSVKGRISAINK